MIFLVKLILAFTTTKQFLSIFVFQYFQRVQLVLKTKVAIFFGLVFVSLTYIIESLWLIASDTSKLISS